MRIPRACLYLACTAALACSADPLGTAPRPVPLGLDAPRALVGSPAVFTVATRQITTNPAPQLDPSISGDIVVYTDLRNGNLDIYFTDLATGLETRVTSAIGAQQLHDVSGNTIVFVDLGTVPSQVWRYDVATGFASVLAPTTFSQTEPTTDAGKAVFETRLASGVNSDLAVSDLSTGTYTVLTSTEAHEGRPVVGGNLIAFERGTVPLDPDGDIVVFDLVNASETVIGTGLAPHTDGHRVAWQTGSATSDIIVRNMTTGATLTIALAGAQTRPRLSGDFLAFDDNSTGTPDVVLMHLPTGATHRLGSANAEFLNDLDGNRLAYTSNETGNLDIFVAEFSVALGAIAVAPANVAFGDVPVATSATQIVTITNDGAADLTVSAVALAPGSDAAFTVQSIHPLVPVTIGPGDVIDVEVRFSATAQVPYAGVLRIHSSDLNTPIVDVPLAGTGTADRTVAQQVEDLLAFFDASLSGGTLTGDGPGSSAAKRLQALRNMLVASGSMIADGAVTDACVQLHDSRDRTDGEAQPPDFAAGPAAAELYQRITDLMTVLGCR